MKLEQWCKRPLNYSQSWVVHKSYTLHTFLLSSKDSTSCLDVVGKPSFHSSEHWSTLKFLKASFAVLSLNSARIWIKNMKRLNNYPQNKILSFHGYLNSPFCRLLEDIYQYSLKIKDFTDIIIVLRIFWS